jgi:hypothetical protein
MPPNLEPEVAMYLFILTFAALFVIAALMFVADRRKPRPSRRERRHVRFTLVERPEQR